MHCKSAQIDQWEEAAFLEELQSKVVAAIAHTETHAEVKDRLGVQQAAALFIHLQKVSPSYAFQSAVVAASVRLSISRHVHIRAASLRSPRESARHSCRCAAAHSLSADDRLNLAGEVWRGLATGCVLDDASIRSHCYKTACALQPCLLPAWQACLHRRAEDPALPNAPYGLLLHALREHGADRLNALEVKAAAFICRSAASRRTLTLAQRCRAAVAAPRKSARASELCSSLISIWNSTVPWTASTCISSSPFGRSQRSGGLDAHRARARARRRHGRGSRSC